KLNVLGNNHYLYLFKEGLIALSNDQYDECIRLLNIGIEQNQINESLNQDMQNIIASTQNLLSTNDNTDESSNPDDMQDASLDTATGKRIILSAYQKNQTPNDSSH
ncbi:MAG: hypothetical protein OEZ58_19370, partial [Gammaproteobacteria bacterium]|nr:hypothetical protein [Gammaproteobacteria bacterium]